METEKNCFNCYWDGMGTGWCVNCDETYSKWKPMERLVKQYVERCLPGENMETYDVVHKPKHYMLFEDKGIEVRDVIEKLVEKFYGSGSKAESLPMVKRAALFESDYVQLMQYLMRFMDKNGVEDLKKARWYLDKLIQSY